MISVLLPTRRRPEQFKRSVKSLFESANGSFELLVRVDEDDEMPVAPYEYKLLTGRRWGYAQLHCYFNEMAEQSSGDWLMLWNDDAVMEEPGWDARLETVQRGLRVTGHFLFPAISRELYQAMGHFSRQAHCDSYVEAVGRGLDCVHFLPISVTHERVSLPECVTDTSAEFFRAECQGWIQEDIRRVKEQYQLA